MSLQNDLLSRIRARDEAKVSHTQAAAEDPGKTRAHGTAQEDTLHDRWKHRQQGDNGYKDTDAKQREDFGQQLVSPWMVLILVYLDHAQCNITFCLVRVLYVYGSTLP